MLRLAAAGAYLDHARVVEFKANLLAHRPINQTAVLLYPNLEIDLETGAERCANEGLSEGLGVSHLLSLSLTMEL